MDEPEVMMPRRPNPNVNSAGRRVPHRQSDEELFGPVQPMKQAASSPDMTRYRPRGNNEKSA